MDNKLAWLKENDIVSEIQRFMTLSDQHNRKRLKMLMAMYEDTKREMIKYRLRLPYCYQLWLLCGNGDL